MKITDEISINPDSLHSVALDKADNTGTFIQIVFDNDDYVHLYNAKEGKGFAEKTKAKIDAYFEIKILDTIKRLQNRHDSTPEEENTLLELTSNIEFQDFRKKIRYTGRNKALVDCYIPKDLLIADKSRLI
jgi:hypothetical protein